MVWCTYKLDYIIHYIRFTVVNNPAEYFAVVTRVVVFPSDDNERVLYCDDVKFKGCDIAYKQQQNKITCQVDNISIEPRMWPSTHCLKGPVQSRFSCDLIKITITF